MKSLAVKTWAGFLNLLVIMGAALFIFAGTFGYWQAWLYLCAFFLPVFFITLHFLKADPKLIERRLSVGPIAEPRLGQKIIQSFASIFFLSMFIIPGLDHRHGWSSVPYALSIISDGMIIVSFWIIYRVFKENSFTSAVIEVSTIQYVISTGPYAVIRHPMYAGAMLLFPFTPLALGSCWGILTTIPMIVVIVLRSLDEEKILHKELEGYTEYCRNVRYRLIPFVW